MADSKLDLLHRVPLFARLDRRDLGEVEQLTDEVDLAQGHVLMRQGDNAQEFYLIVSGRVRVERDGQQVASLAAGDFLGEIGLVDGGRRSATATADEPVRAIVLGRREFHSLLDRYPEIRLRVLEALAERVRRAGATATD